MRFGNINSFAIDCFHEPIQNDKSWVFGRMCVWAKGQILGDINEPACMLNVTWRQIEETLNRINDLATPEFDLLTPLEIFDRINQAIYVHDNRSVAQIVADAKAYRKFDFLTNGGESFDKFRSFIVQHGESIFLLWQDSTDRFFSASVPILEFTTVTQDFINWLKLESKGVC